MTQVRFVPYFEAGLKFALFSAGWSRYPDVIHMLTHVTCE